MFLKVVFRRTITHPCRSHPKTRTVEPTQWLTGQIADSIHAFETLDFKRNSHWDSVSVMLWWELVKVDHLDRTLVEEAQLAWTFVLACWNTVFHQEKNHNQMHSSKVSWYVDAIKLSPPGVRVFQRGEDILVWAATWASIDVPETIFCPEKHFEEW